jgi:glycosyltransferase involved in cell wall biosynthesis
LYVSPVAERGGAETVLLNLLRFHDRSQFHPIACFLKMGPLVDEARRLADRVAVFPTPRLRSFSSVAAIRAIRRLVVSEDVDIVFGNMAMGHVYGGLAAMGTRAEAVWFEHGIVDEPQVVDRLAANVPAAFTFAGSSIAARARKPINGGTQVSIVPPGIDVDEYDAGRHRRGALRRELGIDEAAPVIACIARLQRWKGHLIFLEAAAEIRRQIPEAQFVVAGGTLFGLEEDYAVELRRRAAELLPDGGVHWLGHRDDVAAVLADVDVLLHCPVRPEPFGLVVVEAMAMEVAVVSVSGSGPEEILSGGAGVLVKSGDAHAVAAAAIDLLRNPARRAELARAARRRARECFSAERMVRDIEQAFHELAG